MASPSPSVPIAEPPLDDPKGVPPPLATPMDYQSPESFLQSINVQIQDPSLMSALRSVFNGKSILVYCTVKPCYLKLKETEQICKLSFLFELTLFMINK